MDPFKNARLLTETTSGPLVEAEFLIYGTDSTAHSRRRWRRCQESRLAKADNKYSGLDKQAAPMPNSQAQIERRVALGRVALGQVTRPRALTVLMGRSGFMILAQALVALV